MDVEFSWAQEASPVRRPRSSCSWRSQRWTPETELYGQPLGEAPARDVVPYYVWCDDDFRGVYWAPTGAEGAPALLESVLRRVETAPVLIQARPDGPSITGMPTYFWMELGQSLRWTETAFGMTVEIAAEVRSVEWDFGDGTRVLGGLGEPWPKRSSVRHRYRKRSPSEGYDVSATVWLVPSYRVNGQPAGALAPIPLAASRATMVHELQAVRVD